LLAGVPFAPSGVAINELGSVEVCGRTIRSKAFDATDLLSHLLVPFRLYCATKVCVGGGLTRMRLPRPPLSVCNNFAAIPLPVPLDERKPTWEAELSVTAVAAGCLSLRGEWQGKEKGSITQPRIQERVPRRHLPSKAPVGQQVLCQYCPQIWKRAEIRGRIRSS